LVIRKILTDPCTDIERGLEIFFSIFQGVAVWLRESAGIAAPEFYLTIQSRKFSALRMRLPGE